MAEGFVSTDLADSWIAFSAGVRNTPVNPHAVAVMSEIGIDISTHYSKSVQGFLHRDDFDLIVTVCDDAREACPVFPGNVPQLHMGFEDPTLHTELSDEEALRKFRQVRDEIRRKLIPYLMFKA